MTWSMLRIWISWMLGCQQIDQIALLGAGLGPVDGQLELVTGSRDRSRRLRGWVTDVFGNVGTEEIFLWWRESPSDPSRPAAWPVAR